MKVVYIGANDALAGTVVERLAQEGNDVYFLSEEPLPRKMKKDALYRFYRKPRKGQNFEQLLESLAPDCVVFAGSHYLDGRTRGQSDAEVTLLAKSLRAVAGLPQVRFILLSSTAVYGNTQGAVDEGALLAAFDETGMRFIREERLLDLYRERYDMDTAVIRVSQVYTDRPQEGGSDLASQAFTAVIRGDQRMVADVFQPLHVSDLADAVKRVVDDGKPGVYNVCGSVELSAQRLYDLACQQLDLYEDDIQWEEPTVITLADSGRIRRDLGWNDFRNLEDQLQKGEVSFAYAPKEGNAKKKQGIPKVVRQVIENLLIFAAFFALELLCGPHELFSQINWLMIYVILIAVSYNVYQSALAAGLASIAYLVTQNLNVVEPNTFYSYAGSVLVIVEFVFLGLVVSYTTNMLREHLRSSELDLDLLQDEYDDLKAVNDENVLIKNEYEQRLLTSKTGFPKLYEMTSRLMVQEPDRILMETMQVVSELIGTSTVAVYQGELGNPYLRLVGALSEDSAMEGKTWNLSDWPHIYDAVEKGELYQGKFGSGEPAVVLPVVGQDASVAVILIKRLPFESESLYHINLLKTLSLLLRDSMEKALQYDDLARKDRYVKDTDILKPKAFLDRLLIADEKAEKGLAEYCVVELVHSGSQKKAAQVAGEMLRVTDCLGTDKEGKLYALLSNTGPENLEQLQKRLSASGVEARLIQEAAMVD